MSAFNQRLMVSIVLVPLGMLAIYFGGWLLTLILLCFIAPAAWEFTRLFQVSGFRPSAALVVGGSILLIVARTWDGMSKTDTTVLVLDGLVLAAMVVHLVDYERGHDLAAVDFGVTLSGLVYLGWIGSYLVALRSLPSGAWWTFTVLPAVWWADAGAYLVGSRWGRRLLSPRLSPKKTWEGYIGGVLFGAGSGWLFGFIWQLGAGAGTPVTPLNSALVGLAMGALTVFGDLGESMIKRMAHAKDSGNLIPGHGGAFDRIDSWLWAGVIGFYLITWLWYR